MNSDVTHENRHFLYLACVLAICMLALAGTVAAKPIPITGPTVITQPGQYYIANPVTNSTAPVYIEVRTSGVVIDGKNKVIDGSDDPNSVGVKIVNTAMSIVNVVVKNMVLTDWGTGLWLTDVKDSLIDKVTVSSSTANGILLQNSRGITVQNSVVKDNGGCGMILFGGSASNILQKNTAQGNTLDGIRIRFSYNNLVENNKILNNKGVGLNFNEQGNYNTVQKNTITGNSAEGILLYKSSDNQITQNTLKNNNNGIYLNSECYNNDLYQNTVTCSTYNAIFLNGGSDDNVIRGNIVDNNLQTGLRIRQSDANIFYDNKVRNNAWEGVWLWDSSNNVFYNNYFFNVNNTNLIGTPSNTWNLSLSEVKSITGGKFSGGNSWGQPNGQGFSQITPDSNRDGICDSSFVIATNNVDWLPLKWKKV
ncbi:parallel beta-helix repeat protein [Methanolinea mesophila]|uniref:right-handed parallel beta-helix repeat-containing protein n=1 Tax=Methanolinea mesophila TaxID=547055 RepID=UPI001AEB0789|nr:NosD domain-containing protein [Methanolinea mesophila]MBP1928874.1 parallel beta-helix repeat protein [Methanolinea mesophila]